MKYGCVQVKLVDSWKNALDDNQFASTIIIDLSKAFNSVPHGLLIAKMRAYGVGNDAREFMCSYLSDRFQRAKIPNEGSSWMALLKGIPQGSTLGPSLFNIFMNDIFYYMEICNLVNYADDNTLRKLLTSQIGIKCTKTRYKNAMEWFAKNVMEANPSKFQFMLMKSFTSK